MLGNLYIGGCSLQRHYSNIVSDTAAYTYYKNTSGAWKTKTNYKLSDALKEEWDVITIQQASGDAVRRTPIAIWTAS